MSASTYFRRCVTLVHQTLWCAKAQAIIISTDPHKRGEYLFSWKFKHGYENGWAKKQENFDFRGTLYKVEGRHELKNADGVLEFCCAGTAAHATKLSERSVDGYLYYILVRTLCTHHIEQRACSRRACDLTKTTKATLVAWVEHWYNAYRECESSTQLEALYNESIERVRPYLPAASLKPK